jgi:hypothetical protein
MVSTILLNIPFHFSLCSVSSVTSSSWNPIALSSLWFLRGLAACDIMPSCASMQNAGSPTSCCLVVMFSPGLVVSNMLGIVRSCPCPSTTLMMLLIPALSVLGCCVHYAEKQLKVLYDK